MKLRHYPILRSRSFILNCDNLAQSGTWSACKQKLARRLQAWYLRRMSLPADLLDFFRGHRCCGMLAGDVEREWMASACGPRVARVSGTP